MAVDLAGQAQDFKLFRFPQKLDIASLTMLSAADLQRYLWQLKCEIAMRPGFREQKKRVLVQVQRRWFQK